MDQALLSIEKLLRAPWNFEENYAGVDGDIPVLFTHPFTRTVLPPGEPDLYTALDPEASTTPPQIGISPLLARFCPCAIGSTMLVHFPVVLASPDEGQLWGYVWRILFRMRSAADYVRRKKARVPFSIGKSGFGTPDTRAGVVPGRPTVTIAGERVVRPSTSETIIHNTERPGEYDPPPFFSYVYSDAIVVPTFVNHVAHKTALYPIPPVGGLLHMDYEQGVFDPEIYLAWTRGDRSKAGGCHHVSRFVKCMGNEFAIECYKMNLTADSGILTPRDWNFTFDVNGNVDGGEDQIFSMMLGVGNRGLNPAQPVPVETGVRVYLGKAPQ